MHHEKAAFGFCVFLLAIFSKNILFHSFVFDGAMPWGAWQYYAAKLCVAVMTTPAQND